MKASTRFVGKLAKRPPRRELVLGGPSKSEIQFSQEKMLAIPLSPFEIEAVIPTCPAPF